MRKKWIFLCLAAAAFVGCTNAKPAETETKNAVEIKTTEERMEKTEERTAQDLWEKAKTTPFAAYPELVTYELAKMDGMDNSNMPDGDTYEDNAYTRYLKNMLNIQNQDVFEARGDQYDTNIEMCIASGKLPDVMIISDADVLKKLVDADLIEDLTQAFEDGSSPRLKEIYESYGSSIFEQVTFDGKIMALPETNIEEGPNLLWLRKDWMDELGLEEPKTLSDAEKIIRTFVKKDPGKNGAGNTIGLVCDTELTGGNGYSYEYMLDIVFANYQAFPKFWYYNEEGELVYGSIQPEAKNALRHLNNLYRDGILDPQFLMRSTGNISQLIVNGQCGSFFGAWWAPNNPLMESVKANPDAEWVPYLISTDWDGTTVYHAQNPSYKYVVVRKGFEHPELIFKAASVMFDYIRFEDPDAEEFQEYFQQNVDPTARPLSINVDYNDALKKCFDSLSAALNGTMEVQDLEMLEKSYYDSCQAYCSDPKAAGSEEWAAYTSRITACSLISSEKAVKMQPLFFLETKTMQECWWKLKQLEKEAYLKLITGNEPIKYFDQFVKEWNALGGKQVIQEVQELEASRQEEKR